MTFVHIFCCNQKHEEVFMKMHKLFVSSMLRSQFPLKIWEFPLLLISLSAFDNY